jgi:starvation-inducible DNA-binding protein
MKIDLGISDKKQKKSIDRLSILLADESILYIKTRKFHWNVSGNSFIELHRLFQEQYSEQEILIDSVAERIGKLGGKPIGTMKEFLDKTTLDESPNVIPNQEEMLTELLNDHEKVVRTIRKDLDHQEDHLDVGTIDFLTGIIEQHESTAWILRRYLS